MPYPFLTLNIKLFGNPLYFRYKIKLIKPIKSHTNFLYKIDADNRSFILRLCQPKGYMKKTTEEIRAEIELILYLKNNNFPTMTPILMENKNYVIKIGKSAGFLREYEEGEYIQDPTLEQITTFGKTLGWFHNIIENYKTEDERKHIYDYNETLKNFKEDKEMLLKSELKDPEDFVKRLESELILLKFPENLPKGMIHEDLGKRHVLWKYNKITCIIDFDRSYYGPLLLDTGQTIRGWCTDNWKTINNEKLSYLLKGYELKRKLTEEENQHLEDAIKFGCLERALAFSMRLTELFPKLVGKEFTKEELIKYSNFAYEQLELAESFSM